MWTGELSDPWQPSLHSGILWKIEHHIVSPAIAMPLHRQLQGHPLFHLIDTYTVTLPLGPHQVDQFAPSAAVCTLPRFTRNIARFFWGCLKTSQFITPLKLSFMESLHHESAGKSVKLPCPGLPDKGAPVSYFRITKSLWEFYWSCQPKVAEAGSRLRDPCQQLFLLLSFPQFHYITLLKSSSLSLQIIVFSSLLEQGKHISGSISVVFRHGPFLLKLQNQSINNLIFFLSTWGVQYLCLDIPMT